MRSNCICSLLAFAITIFSIAGEVYTYKADNYRNKLFTYLNGVLNRVIEDPQPAKYPTSGKNEITVLTWNVLAPIRIDFNQLSGLADPNLFDVKIRMNVIGQRILDLDADVVNIQEIQADTYETLREYIKDVYDAASFSPHGPLHWIDLPPGVANVRNGITTFYKKKKFRMWREEQFLTSDNGNTAQATVLKMYKQPPRRLVSDPTFLMVNCHLQHGFGFNDSFLRVSQISTLVEKTTNLTKEITEAKEKEPTVFLSGDFNSIAGAPGIDSLKGLGWIDPRDVLNNTQNSIYYPELVITSFLPPLEGLPIDTVFAPQAQVESKRTKFTSITIPDIEMQQYSEMGFTMHVLNLLTEELHTGRLDREDAIHYLDTLLSSLLDGKDYDSKYNRAIRIGSDHLPVLIGIKLKI